MARNKKNINKSLYFILPIILILIAGYFYFVNHKSKQTISVTSTGSAASGKQATNNTSSSSNYKSQSTSGGNVSSVDKSNSSSNSINLITPYGTFVSNHKPSLSGTSSPSSEQSVCNTSQGVSCYIEFIMGSTIKQLPTQTTDNNGSAYWTWDVKKAGLTTGDWQITAVVSQNGETKTANDSLKLSVDP